MPHLWPSPLGCVRHTLLSVSEASGVLQSISTRRFLSRQARRSCDLRLPARLPGVLADIPLVLFLRHHPCLANLVGMERAEANLRAQAIPVLVSESCGHLCERHIT